MADIVIYKTKDGHTQLDVTLTQETLWLSQQQMGQLFGTQRQAISKRLKNIFNSKELSEKAVCSILERTAKDGKKYKTKFYNLDAIVSVGYRVNSIKATKFRVWATQVLKEHLTKGYSIYEKCLAERGFKEIQQYLALLQKMLTQNELVNDIGDRSIQLIMSHAKNMEPIASL